MCSEQGNLVARYKTVAEISEPAQKVSCDCVGVTDKSRSLTERPAGSQRVIDLTTGSEIFDIVYI
ncbi:hypothetical protein HQO42_12380 [Rhodococcus fascians]|nr:hypothetical protein [Rhodococcus fascians]MBY4253452.1 hypothetical protein [Rhodococcus fascians]MBY4269089.1 hypothetical protein [Rhodococcus fascians]